MASYMERLLEIRRKVFEISCFDDYLNVLSDTSILAQEMAQGQPTPEETDLLERLSSVLEHDPRTVSEEEE